MDEILGSCYTRAVEMLGMRGCGEKVKHEFLTALKENVISCCVVFWNVWACRALL